MFNLTEEMLGSIWMVNNPYVFYADYRDEIPEEKLQLLLEGDFENFEYWLFECTADMEFYADTSYMKEEYASVFDVDDFDELSDNLQEVFNDFLEYSYEDYIKTCFNNTKANVVATPFLRWGVKTKDYNSDYVDGKYQLKKDENGNFIYRDYEEQLCHFPAHCADRESVLKFAKFYSKLFNVRVSSVNRAECTYPETPMKVIGQIDFYEIYKTGKVPKFVVIPLPEDRDSGYDNVLAHESLNGSGSMGTFPRKRRVCLHANFRIDSTMGYGIQSVYGFDPSMWSNDLETFDNDKDAIEYNKTI